MTPARIVSVFLSTACPLIAVLSATVVLNLSSRGAAADPRVISPGEQAAQERISALMSRMTLEEKLGQLTQQWGNASQDVNPDAKQRNEADLLGIARSGAVGSFLGTYGAAFTSKLQHEAVEKSRLKIPLIIGNDVIHGYRTIFPIPLAEAATWSPELAELSARVAATEASASGTHWTFAPMVDICRDPRWGRIAEGAGEDPYLGAAFAAARVRGFQGARLSDADSIVACAKHYAAYGGAEGGRDYNTVDISLQTLHDVHLPTYKAAVNAGTGTLMSSFNEINGMPATGSRYLLHDVLREQWGFRGFVVSDWESVTEMIAHGYARDAADAAQKAITAGVDMDMSSFSYRTHLGTKVASGEVSMQVIGRAVRRVLMMKLRLGLFDNPFQYGDEDREARVTLCKEHRAAARRVARNAIVMLENRGAVLPLNDRPQRIAIIGPLADNQKDPLGTWKGFGRPEDVVTVLQGIRHRAPHGSTVKLAKGCEVRGGDQRGFDEAIKLANESDVVLLVLGESEDMSGEAHSRADIGLPPNQLALAKKIVATGKPTILVLMNGRPMTLPWCAKNVPGILVTWHLGVECGNAIADVLFGDHNPSGKLPATFPRHVGQIPLYYAHKNTGRPPVANVRYNSKYIDMPWTPQYAFGYGLSYTQYEYSNLKVSPDTIGPFGEVKVSADVTNAGSRAGVEIAQLYIRDLVGSLTRPVRQLQGFQRVPLAPGETKTVHFTLGHHNLGFTNADVKYVVEPGEFKVWVGPNSQEGIEGSFRVR